MKMANIIIGGAAVCALAVTACAENSGGSSGPLGACNGYNASTHVSYCEDVTASTCAGYDTTLKNGASWYFIPDITCAGS